MNTPVKFEIAKLLKEKGIKIDTDEVIFYRDEVNNIEEHQIKNRDVLYSYTGMDPYPAFDENEYQTYIIAEVVMWLYEKHGIWIYPFRHDFNKEFYWSIDTKNEDEYTSDDKFNSPTEAYEAAIEYTLNNLI